MEFTADQVWGLAVRADTQNGGYLKEAKMDYETGKVITEANKVLVKQWLRDNAQPTEAEVAKGREYRAFFNSYTMKALTGQINDFERQALKIAQMDMFTGRNMLEFAIISCLPSTARRDQERTALKREIFASTQLKGNVGDEIRGEVQIVSCKFNYNFNKFRISARMGESFVDFWYSRELQKDATLRIKGKIKNVREDNTTQLNYVKVL